MAPFKLSNGFEVTLDDKRQIISIGCRNYRVEYIKRAFAALLAGQADRVTILSADGGNIIHGINKISFTDAELILAALGAK